MEKSGEIAEECIETQLMNLQVEGKVVFRERDGEDIIYAAYFYNRELDAARMLLENKSMVHVEDEEIRRILKEIEKKNNMTLDELQKEAVRQAVEQGVVERIQQRAARPTENGIRPGGAATVRPDVASMTRAQREALERRVLHGAQIEL